MTRVLHTADTHIGYRQYHSPERRADFLAAFRAVVEDAIADGVDAVVHAGDLFHSRHPALADIHGTIGVLRDLAAADIPFLAVVGNHERTRGEQWLDLFETLGLATRLGRDPVTIGTLAVYGLDFVPRSRRDDVDLGFEPHGADHAALVTHGPFTPFVPDVRTDRWALEPILDDATVDFDAALLGDEHAAATERVAGTWATYPGSTERCDASERADRGYNLVTFDGEVSVSRRGIETRSFVPIDIELAPGEGPERVRERVREEAVEDAVVIVTITGDGEAVPPARIEEFALERGALVARVSDRRDAEDDPIEEIRFADPDAAARERVRSMGLSDAALAVDETIRDQTPDTRVRDEVKALVADLAADDPDAFEPAAPDDSESDTEATADAGVTDDGAASDDEGSPTGEDPDDGPPQVTMDDFAP